MALRAFWHSTVDIKSFIHDNNGNTTNEETERNKNGVDCFSLLVGIHVCKNYRL